MPSIRPLSREDVPAVAELYELVMRSGTRRRSPALEEYFERTLLDHPWADPEIPSLVHVDRSGRIVAFQGSHARRATFDGDPIRIACAGQLVAHPDARSHGAGALLVRACLSGQQDLTITDGATEPMRHIWTRLGGQMVHLSCLSWTRLVRPLRFVSEHAARRWLSPRAVSWPGPRGRFGLARRMPALMGPHRSPALESSPLTPVRLLEQLPLMRADARLVPAYDERYLEWLFTELRAVAAARGELIANLVSDPHGRRTLGWYVYYLRPRGTSEVLTLSAGAGDAGKVLDHLLDHAARCGTAAIRGRIEPRLLEPLAARRCLFRFTGEALMHSRHREIVAAAGSGSSLLTRLDGEWWMGHHLLNFDRAV